MPSSRKTAASRLHPHGPLVFDTRDLAREPGSVHTQTRTAPAPAGLSTGMARIPAGADMDLSVTLESVPEGVLVTLTATAPVAGECARCLEPVTQTVEVACRELFSYDQDGGDDGEGGYSLDGDLLDLEPALRDALVLALPLAPRCKDDCPGLCAECGARLAEVGPGHHHGHAADPRWEGLRLIQPTQAGPDGSPARQTSEENGRGRP
jgi:uncharacterized protein